MIMTDTPSTKCYNCRYWYPIRTSNRYGACAVYDHGAVITDDVTSFCRFFTARPEDSAPCDVPETCKTCRFRVRPANREPLHHECHKNPPKHIGELGIMADPSILAIGSWPRVDLSEWCGEWQPRYEAHTRKGEFMPALPGRNARNEVL